MAYRWQTRGAVTWTAAVAIAVAVAAGGGCEKEDRAAGGGAATPAEGVTPKAAPGDPGTVPQPASPPTPATGPAAATGVAESAAGEAPGESAAAPAAGKRESAGGVSWETPAGWKLGGDAPMRLATLTDGTAEIRVSAFPGNVGGVMLNINRWRGEVGLPQVESDDEAEKLMTEIDVDGRKVRVADLSGPRGRTLVAMVPGDGKLFFFKMMGPAETVDARKGAFNQLVKTIRVE